ncbi:LysR substrate-binding domain-containing protein [Bosea sp. 685]|uniref:LysR substrate-binding domain-containing protein n=1 Tax=Bosea sp. 685 TaxID=3080057 RepID=UPI002892BBA4|nr:LysR substrate-binding domain-containing protein [Bosea sp. 685]WNJ89834.1 LysR substrate-binding domain-containing protein [Bosea sp. 685]
MLIRMIGKKTEADPVLRQIAASPRVGLPPLNSLLAFRAASRHASFAQGADELGVTPSAISHQIQRLEGFLGVKLFQRDAGRTALTSAGAVYAREVEHAFDVLSDATSLVAPRAQTDHLTIACSPSFAAKWLQPRLPDFLNAHPDVRIRLSTLCYRDDIEADSFDIAVAYGRPAVSHKLIEPLLMERLRPLCSPAHAATARLRTPKDLERATLIHSVNALTWPAYMRKIGAGSVRCANEVWLDQSDMAIEAAVRGVGVILESEVLAGDELNKGELVSLFGDKQFSVDLTTYYIVKSRRQRRGNHVDAFEKWLRAAVASEVAAGLDSALTNAGAS